MMETDSKMIYLRKVKGGVYFVAFVLVGVFMALEPNKGVTHILTNIGIPAWGWTLIFFISAVMSFYTGLANQAWNAIWFTPLYMYTTATMFVWYHKPQTMATSAVILITLLAWTTLWDVLRDFIEIRQGER